MRTEIETNILIYMFDCKQVMVLTDNMLEFINKLPIFNEKVHQIPRLEKKTLAIKQLEPTLE